MIKKFSIGGMTCSACSAGIERNVKKASGVNSASVSLMEKTMSVDYDENVINDLTIIAIVEKLGYTAEIYGNKKEDKYIDAKKLKRRFIVSLCVLLPLMYFCMGNMIGLLVPINQVNFPIQFLLATVVLIINRKFFINGVKAVLHGTPNMDTLVSLGSASAYVYSIVLTVFLYCGKEVYHTFFEASAMVVTLVTLGKWLEELSKIKTGDAIEKLGNLLPKTAVLIVDGKEKTILTSQLKVGDIILLKAGDYVAVDGVVVEGSAGVDKSAITGESMPEEVKKGSAVSSGSILKHGYLHLKAEKVGEETLFSKIVEIVKTAGTSKAPIQKFADKISGIFVPVVCLIAVITFVVWLLITGDWDMSFGYGITVLVISCPCSLGLATPVAVMAATGRGANSGILFKNAEALQNAYKINCVLLDKTATITVGKPKVTDYKNYTGESNQMLYPVISALETKANHPLAQCVVDFCGQSDKEVTEYEYITGKGITGVVDDIKYYLGNREIIPSSVEVEKLPAEYEGQTTVYFADDYQLISVFAISDYVKEDSKEAITKLNEKGIKTVMITGDNKGVAKRIADEVKITEFEAEVLPQDKYSIVEKYKTEGYFTAMVGDGINDSPALKSADVGVAMGTGTDIAIDSSDVVIANGSLNSLNKMIDLSKKSVRIIKENLFWAFFYNVLGIPIAAGVFSFFGFALTPSIASAMMSLSSLFVVTNALRIAKPKKKDKLKTICACDLVKKIITVEGMMCNHCVQKVKTALENTEGITSVEVNLTKKTATVLVSNTVADNKLFDAIKKAGFNAVEIKK